MVNEKVATEEEGEGGEEEQNCLLIAVSKATSRKSFLFGRPSLCNFKSSLPWALDTMKCSRLMEDEINWIDGPFEEELAAISWLRRKSHEAVRSDRENGGGEEGEEGEGGGEARAARRVGNVIML